MVFLRSNVKKCRKFEVYQIFIGDRQCHASRGNPPPIVLQVQLRTLWKGIQKRNTVEGTLQKNGENVAVLTVVGFQLILVLHIDKNVPLLDVTNNIKLME